MNNLELSQMAMAIVMQQTDTYLTPAQRSRMHLFASDTNARSVEYVWGKSLAHAIVSGGFSPQRELQHVTGHIFKDAEGYRFFDGIRVEHFSFSDFKAEYAATEELEGRCTAALCKRVIVTGRSALGGLVHAAPDASKYLPLLMTYYGLMKHEETGDVAFISNVFQPLKASSSLAVTKTASGHVWHSFEGHYQAFHAFQDNRYRFVNCNDVEDGYGRFVEHVDQIGLPVEEILAKTGYSFLL